MKISWLTLSFLNFWGFLNMKVSSSFFDHNAHLLKESRSITVFQVFFSIFVFSYDCDRLLVFVSNFSDFTVSWLDGNVVVVFQLSSHPHPLTPSWYSFCSIFLCVFYVFSWSGFSLSWTPFPAVDDLLFSRCKFILFGEINSFLMVFTSSGGLKKTFREATSPSFWLCVPYL